jgi:hypothetical protein
VFERAFSLSGSKLFNWFFWTYNAGLIWTGGFLAFNGTNTVLSNDVSPLFAQMSGVGHILLTIAFVLFFICLRPRVFGTQESEQHVEGTAVGRQLVSMGR